MIKYECDICGQEVYTIEALGPGVYVENPNGVVRGKAYEYYDEATNLNFKVIIHDDDTSKEHFCKACMWKALERMMDTFAPKEVELEPEVLRESWEAMAHKAGLWPERWVEDQDDDQGAGEWCEGKGLCTGKPRHKVGDHYELFKPASTMPEIKVVKLPDEEVDDLSHTDWTGAAVGPFTVKFEATGLPKPPFFVKVVPNEEADSSPEGADSDLPELYFEGVLQETGPDAGPDDPGTAKESDTPNRDDRPGWEYKSTANGI